MWRFENIGATASTQQTARERVQANPGGPFVIYSTQQWAGLGQRGRQWAHSGEALACSFAWPEPRGASAQKAPAWPLWVSLAVAQAVEDALGFARNLLQIKWPNDLIWEGRKCAGVLVTRSSAHSVPWLIAGVGLNLRWLKPPEGFVASGLLEGDGRPWDEGLQAELLGCLGRSLTPLQSAAPLPGQWLDSLAQRDWLAGKRVSLVHPDTRAPLCEGTAQGVDAQGLLRVQTLRGQELAFAIGEASPSPWEAGP